LVLSHNLIEIIPGTFNNLINLENLNLSYNKIKYIPIIIGNLVNLKHLNLSNNKIKYIPDIISNLVNLKDLNISYNNIFNIPPTFKKLINLQKLNLNNLNLEKSKNIVKNISNIPKLLFLELYNINSFCILKIISLISDKCKLFLHDDQIDQIKKNTIDMKKYLFVNDKVIYIKNKILDTIDINFKYLKYFIKFLIIIIIYSGPKYKKNIKIPYGCKIFYTYRLLIN
jgi:Leucine-rich repeat (LRR) protein